MMNAKGERDTTAQQIEYLSTKVPSLRSNVANLSGGNQQKVVLSKWFLMKNMKVLLLDEPTRGIDVGAKYEIYKLINDLAFQGIAIVIITSELPELLGLCDRIAVMNDGRVNGIINRDEFSQERIMQLCV
jgi:ABC-type sugar transport system ATPase subunit